MVSAQYDAARHISLALAILAFLALGMRLPIAVLCYCAAFTCLLDVLILLRQDRLVFAIRRASHAAILMIFGSMMIV